MEARGKEQILVLVDSGDLVRSVQQFKRCWTLATRQVFALISLQNLSKSNPIEAGTESEENGAG
jgi:hypothetical protein